MPELTTAQRLAAYRHELLDAGFSDSETRDFVEAAAPSAYEDVEIQADLDDEGTAIGEVRVRLNPQLDPDDLRRVAERARAVVDEAAR